MKYDIYFHNDFDGRASAAVMLAFLRSRGDDIARYVPVDYYLENEWKREDFFRANKLVKGRHNPAIVVDFLYHPKAAFWFDHHPTTVKKEAWKKRFRQTRFHVLDPKQPSCCRVVVAALERNFGWKSPRRLKDLAHAADIIDGAEFKDVRQPIVLHDPAMAIEAFIDNAGRSGKLARWMVNEMTERSLKEIAALPVVRTVVRKVRVRNLKNLVYYRRHMKIFPNTTFIDLTHDPEKFLRPAPYYLRPDIPYAMRFIRKDGGYGLRVGMNIWARPGVWKRNRRIDLGKLCARYGGGGHAGAAGINFPTRKEIEVIIPDVLKRLARTAR